MPRPPCPARPAPVRLPADAAPHALPPGLLDVALAGDAAPRRRSATRARPVAGLRLRTEALSPPPPYCCPYPCPYCTLTPSLPSRRSSCGSSLTSPATQCGTRPPLPPSPPRLAFLPPASGRAALLLSAPAVRGGARDARGAWRGAARLRVLIGRAPPRLPLPRPRLGQAARARLPARRRGRRRGPLWSAQLLSQGTLEHPRRLCAASRAAPAAPGRSDAREGARAPQLLGKGIDKRQQCSNWDRRPLLRAQVAAPLSAPPPHGYSRAASVARQASAAGGSARTVTCTL